MRRQSMLDTVFKKKDLNRSTGYQMSQVGLMEAVKAAKNFKGHKALAIVLEAAQKEKKGNMSNYDDSQP